FVRERVTAAYTIASQCEMALARTREYVGQRRVFGETLANAQYVAFRLTELSAQLELLRSHNYQCALSLAAGEDVTRGATVAKLSAGRLAREVADVCLQFHGGIGYMEETWTARFFRDMRLSSIGGGADEVMLKVLARLDGLPA
ncbi:Acyl-CoA oxidase/dehydrogenase, type 1 domain protein, partial [mine drainage metagenome]